MAAIFSLAVKAPPPRLTHFFVSCFYWMNRERSGEGMDLFNFCCYFRAAYFASFLFFYWYYAYIVF